MRDDLPDASLKMALANGMCGIRRDRVPALVARNPVLLHRLSAIVADPDTRENWKSLVELHESACAILAARNAADAIAAMLALEINASAFVGTEAACCATNEMLKKETYHA